MQEGKKDMEYYLGLDMGTDSVGWAVTDDSYNIRRKNGKDLWGIRLFEAAQPAAQRRLFRTSRRRTQRRSGRIKLLQELFAQAVCEKDPGFFQRLNDSRYLPEDKKAEQSNTLFNDKDYTDKDYHKTYPTIYHLRKALMNSDKPFDVRLVYLAVHHIIKHRGHFLFDSFSVDEKGVSGIHEMFQNLCDEIDDLLAIPVDTQKEQEVGSILKNKKYGVKIKGQSLLQCMSPENSQGNKNLKAIATMLAGGSASLSDVFSDEGLKEFEKNKVSFSKSSYEEDEALIQTELGDRFELIHDMKQLYDWSLLAELMGNCHYLSDAKVQIYEKHKKDLEILKALLKPNAVAFKHVFRNTGANSYSAYVGVCIEKGKKQVIDKACTAENFYKEIKSIIDHMEDSDYKEYVLEEIGTANLLPKAVSKINGVIPYQLHEQELKIILKNAEKYLPFLNVSDRYGSIADKILKLLTFRIPYYIGPLNTAHAEKSEFAWMVRKDEKGHIYPWNFEEKVDTEKSAEAFIRRMTNKCTYLLEEDVLPKNSLLYTEYMVFNELNNVKIGAAEKKLTPKEKEQIVHNLFLKKNKVTGRDLSRYLIREGTPKEEAEIIGGIDKDFKSSLVPWRDFDHIFGENKPERKIRECIVKDITLFGLDRNMLKRRIEEDYPEISKEELRQVMKLKYNGWGRLSRKFLTGIYPKVKKGINAQDLVNKGTGELMNIITALKETSNNLMELLSDKYGYSTEISEENSEKLQGDKLSYQMVEKLRVSPSVRRPIWQTLEIVKEVRKILGADPARIFVEMARGGEIVKQRTKSRKERLLELYRNCKEDTRNWRSEIEKQPDDKLRSDRLYLYYTQMGKCMYSGEAIDISALWDKNIYDVDHIYPQSQTADDSLENRVLVKRKINAAKSDTYPLSEEIQRKMSPFWDMLRERGLIGKQKYSRLIRKTALTEDEKADFIGRQLVETRQSTKAAAEILKRVFPNTQIIYAKAGNASRFRQNFDFLKVRDVNDFHHAKDAYINIVTGNAYYTKFTSNPVNFLKSKNNRYSLNKAMYDHSISRGDYVAWTPGEDGTIAVVRKWMKKNDILFTRLAFEQTGGLFDQMPVKKGKGQVPLKCDGSPIQDIKKYGGYNKAGVAYFMYVQAEQNDRKVYLMESVPIYKKQKLTDNVSKEEYCAEVWEKSGKPYDHPKILIPEIRINSLFDVDGFRMHLSGKNDKQIILKNAMQLCIAEEEAGVIKRIKKFIDREKTEKGIKITKFDKIDEENTIHLYDTFLAKLNRSPFNSKLSSPAESIKKGREKFLQLSLEDRCQILMEIIHLFQCNPVAANLKLIGGPQHSGILTLSSNFSNYHHVSLISQSPTGFFEKKMLLVPLSES